MAIRSISNSNQNVRMGVEGKMVSANRYLRGIISEIICPSNERLCLLPLSWHLKDAVLITWDCYRLVSATDQETYLWWVAVTRDRPVGRTPFCEKTEKLLYDLLKWPIFNCFMQQLFWYLNGAPLSILREIPSAGYVYKGQRYSCKFSDPDNQKSKYSWKMERTSDADQNGVAHYSLSLPLIIANCGKNTWRNCPRTLKSKVNNSRNIRKRSQNLKND